jgi:hypothetical protein
MKYLNLMIQILKKILKMINFPLLVLIALVIQQLAAPNLNLQIQNILHLLIVQCLELVSNKICHFYNNQNIWAKVKIKLYNRNQMFRISKYHRTMDSFKLKTKNKQNQTYLIKIKLWKNLKSKKMAKPKI